MKNISCKLKPQHKRFADNFLKTANASQSYIDAGYKTKGEIARVSASRLLQNDNIKAYIDKTMNKINKVNFLDMAVIHKFWYDVATGVEKDKYLTINPVTGKHQEIDVTPKMQDRIKTTELIAKVNGAFVQKVEIAKKPNKIDALIEALKDEEDEDN